MNESTLSLLHTLLKSSRLSEARLDNLLEGLNLSATRLWALRQLERAAQPVSLGNLADAMAFAKSNATQLVDHLEEAGLVRRVPDASDRRCTRLALTSAGGALTAAGLEALHPLADQIEALFTPAEREQLAALLERLIQAG